MTVGLTMNLERLLYRDAVAAFLGTAAATSNTDLPRIWFDARADYESQINGLSWETNGARAEARAMSKKVP